jgi:lipopolysaccharide exporter
MDPLDQPPLEPSPAPAESFGQRAAVGFVWMALQTVASKFITVAGQVVLAWLLSDTDFGVIALAFTAAAFPGQLNQIGLKEVLVRRSKRYQLWASSAHWMALGFGLLSGLLIAAIAPLAAHIFKTPRLIGLLLIMAITAPVELLSQVVVIKLQIDLRFRAFAALAFVLAIGGIALSVLFAAMGAGPYSFVLPLPIVAVVRLAIAWLMVRPPFERRIDFQRWRYLLGDSLLMLAARTFLVALLIGDYLSLGFFHPKQIVGIYYFAYTLSLQTIVLFAVNLEGVLFPTLSRLTDDLPRQRQGFVNAARVLAIVAIPICFLQAALSGPLMHAIFPAKWLPAIPVLTVLCIGMAFRSVGFPSFSLMQAQGRFKALSMLLSVGVVIFLIMTFSTSALTSDARAAVAMAIVVSIYFAMEGPISIYVGVRHAGGGWREVWGIYFIPVILSAIACAAAAFLIRFLPARTRSDHLVRMMAGALVAGAIYLPLIRLLSAQTWEMLVSRVWAIIKR